MTAYIRTVTWHNH